MSYVLDANISPHYAKMLRALNNDVFAIRELLPANTSDEDIFEALRIREMRFVSGDRKILSREYQVLALRQSGISAIFFSPFWNNLPFWDQAAWLVRRWPAIEEGFLTYRHPCHLIIQQNGKVKPVAL